MKCRTSGSSYLLTAATLTLTLSLHAQTQMVCCYPVGGGGSGTVTSVGLTAPAEFEVAGSPVTTSGTLALTLAAATQNTIFAGPASGGDGTPLFRAMVSADLPATITGLTSVSSTVFVGALTGNASTATALAANPAPCGAGDFVTDIAADGTLTCDEPTGGISSLNALTAATQTFATGTSGTNFTISSASSTHTFNLPDASASARGLVTTGAQTFAGVKTIDAGNGTAVIGGSYAYQASQTNAFRADAAGVAIVSGGPILGSGTRVAWSSTANWYDTVDASLSRVAAGVVAVGTGPTSSVAGSVRATHFEAVVGANVASAATITLTGGIQHVTGAVAISTINLPRAGFTGCAKLIPDGLWTLATGGNIAIAATATISRVMDVCYDGTLWYPSYLL